ncbi:hypothetical protein BTH42_33805, partial [Burkholderia sp. SRS-W-2-2016]
MSVGSSGNERRVTNVAAGSAATDAVNVSQLQSEAVKSANIGATTAAALGGGATYNADGTITAPSYSVDGTQVTNVGAAISNIDGRVTTNAGNITTLQGQMADAVMYDTPAHDSLTLGGANAAPVALHNVANGVAGTDAINVNQLNTATTQLGNQISNVSSSLTNATRYFKANGNNDGTDDAVATGANAVAVGRNAVAGPASATAIGAGANALGQSSLAIGAGATATSDVSGGIGGIAIGQFATAGNNPATGGQVGPSIAIGGSSQADKYSVALGNGARALQDNGLALGSMARVTAANAVALGYGSTADRANSVSIGSVGAERQVVNLAAGTAGTDAVNVSQLKGTAQSVAEALGGGATVTADGTIGAPSYSVGGTTVGNVGDAVSNIDGRVTTNAGNIATLQGQMADAVSYDTSAHTSVTLGGAAAAPVALHNVAAGDLSASSTDAVNGSQLNTTNQNVADLGSQVAKNTGDISNVQTTLSDAVMYDSASHNSVTLGGANAAAPVALKNVADGVDNNDAVNVSQLNTTNQNVADLGSQVTKNAGDISNVQATLSDAVMYDSAAHNSVTLGGANAAAPVALKNVADGVDNNDAVNVSQLNTTNQNVADLGSQVTKNAGDISNVQATLSDAVMYDSAAHNSVTLGGANAAAPVALKNVADGVDNNDAVNVSQLNTTNQNVADLGSQVTKNAGDISNVQA